MKESIIISGRGGTGKTSVAASFATLAEDTVLADCHIEEPNGHLFLKPGVTKRKPVTTPVPRVADEACHHSGQCGEICQYSAIVPLRQRTLAYLELCHGCGGRTLICPSEAITEAPRIVESWAAPSDSERGGGHNAHV